MNEKKDFVKDYIDKREQGKELAEIDGIETVDHFEPNFAEICPVCKHYNDDIKDPRCPCKGCSIYYV